MAVHESLCVELYNMCACVVPLFTNERLKVSVPRVEVWVKVWVSVAEV